MTHPDAQPAQPAPHPTWRRLLSLITITLIASISFTLLWSEDHFEQDQKNALTHFEKTAPFNSTVKKLDQAFAKHWQQAGVQSLAPAPPLIIARRLSLALTGTIPSLEEINTLQTLPSEKLTQWHLSQLLLDRRWSDYVAERLARSYVGTIDGPFLVYRRRRLIDWLSKQLFENRPYDQLVRQLITAKGIWTSHPEVNFITVTIDQNKDEKGPNEAKLAARVSRAFLGIRIDCMECHNDKFGDRWKQKDFHQLASFFGKAQMSLTGIRDNGEKPYQYRYRGKKEAQTIPAQVPFNPEWLPTTGNPREQLAQWVTHQDNRPFARSTVNRIWALLFNKPLVEPIDDIPLDGPWPATMEILADELLAHDFDLQHLIRIIVASQVFQLDSRAQSPASPPSELHEKNWASFPITRLRPEQVAHSVIQSASITTIDAHSHIIQRLLRFLQQGDFLKRYGDAGENEFTQSGGTIPQRLLLMNGKLLHERTEKNPLLNASTRIGMLSTDKQQAIQTAYLAIFTRAPEKNELTFFTQQLEQLKDKNRDQAMEDIFWTLLNSTEFSWNH